MSILFRSFSGGYRFKNFAGQATDEQITAELPEKVIIPMKQGFGNELTPKVKPGEKVKAGQIIAQDDKLISSPIHSSVNGIVKEIISFNYFNREMKAVLIESDNDPSFIKITTENKDWHDLSPEEVGNLIYKSGVSSLDREGIPTGFKSSIILPGEVEDVIIHGVGSEPYNLSLGVLLSGKRILNFVEGIEILQKVMGRATFHIAFSKYDKILLEELRKLTSDNRRIKIYGLSPKYPQGFDEVLVPTILGKKFPYGYSAANIGIVILNIQAVQQVYEAVVTGKPLIERTVALCGTGFKNNFHLNVRIGSPLESVLKGRLDQDIHSRLIINSPLTGIELTDLNLPLNKTFSQIIALDNSKDNEFLSFIRPGVYKDSYSNCYVSTALNTQKKVNTLQNGERRPCIFCNYCQQACPAGIIPHYIYHHVERGFVDQELMRFAIFNCIKCNLCSYVCPSKIPLAKYISEGMVSLTDRACDRSLVAAPGMDLKGLEEYRGLK